MKFEVRKGSFRYKRGKEVLKDIDFSLEEACILSVLGANGAGKTTLLKCMLGLLPWSRGGSYLDGNNIREIPSRMFWRHVGYVPQAKPISFVYTVREMVVLGRNTHLRDWEQPSEEDWKIVDQCLERVGILSLRDRLCNQISGGEYQLVLVARALASSPSLLVLDEPESNLDFRNQTIVLDVIRRLCREEGISAVLNTHYPEHALDISHKSLLLMPDGTALFGNTGEILREDTLEQAFDVPVRIQTLHLPEREYTCVFPLLPENPKAGSTSNTGAAAGRTEPAKTAGTGEEKLV